MYKEFYLMRREPFDSHPSPELFYKSNVHQTAWHYLVQGIKQHEPILVLAGDYGAGKTLLFLKLVRLLEQKGRAPIVAVPTPTYNFVMMLEKIVEKLLNIAPGTIDTADESKLQQAIYEYFENTETKAPVYVLIDDAQEFSYSFINKLRLFASYNCGGFFPIRLIFFAHKSFLKMLTYKKLVALGQRIKRIYHLKPLNFNETREYIYFRLIHSGATGTPVFDDDAIELIQTVTGGNPRLINNVCDNCLLVAGERRVNLIDPDLVYLAMEKGSLPGIETLERPADPVQAPAMPEPQAQWQPPVSSQSVGTGGALPQFSGMPMPQYPEQPPYPAQEYVSGPAAPYAPPTGGQSVYPEASQPQSHGYHEEVKPSFSSNFLSRYGRISVIILLALIAVFLATYLVRAERTDMGSAATDNRKIVRKIPAQRYTIRREIPAEPWAYSPERDLARAGGQAIARESRDRRNRTYEPVLLTDSLGGVMGEK